jgi:hypothetical protein
MTWTRSQLELMSRLMEDEDYYLGHPFRTGRWLLRYARARTFKRRLEEVRTGSAALRGEGPGVVGRLARSTGGFYVDLPRGRST